MSSPLRDKFIRHMVLQGLSRNTQDAYLRAIVELVRYYRCSPDELTNDQIQGFLQELIEVRKRTWSTVNVEQGKGRKDRYTILFDWVLEELRGYWREYRPLVWLFAGQDPNRHLTIGSAQRVYYQARDAAGITRGRGIHTLRHCFASHLLESGVDLFTVKRLLGHASLKTTAGYLHVGTVQHRPLQSPLDEFDLPK